MHTTKAIVLLICAICYLHSALAKSLSIYEQQKYKHLLDGQGLYLPEDDVEILTRANFKDLVYRQKHAWVIEFYNSWCGFCQRFAPSWKALATDIKLWNRMVKVGAIDCSDDANSPLCREYEIMGYPTLRYFHEFYQSGVGTEIQKGADLAEHKKFLLGHMIEEQMFNGRGVNFPNLAPYRHGNLNHLVEETSAKAIHRFLVIDNADTLIGPQLQLDFDNVPEIGIRYATFNNTPLISHLNVNQLPALVALSEDNKVHKFGNGLKTHDDFRAAIIEHVKPDLVIEMNAGGDVYKGKWLESDIPDLQAFLHEKEKQAIRLKIKEMGDAVYQVDLETALRRSFMNEVATVRVIEGEKLAALREYVNVLRKYFPFGANGKVFLMKLFNLVHKNSVQGEEISDLLKEHEPSHKMVFSSTHNWMACEGSTSAKRGFPCGLWKLFHYLTVQAADGVNDPKEVLHAMHGYIENFFGCADCARHFLAMAERRDLENVNTLNAAILWLWSAHNEVNNRLAGDETEDPEYPKVQFPSAASCGQCRLTNGDWNYPEILRYLKSMYSRYNVKYLGSDVRVLQQPRQDANSASSSIPISGASSVFEQLDASMCFILYVISFVLIIVLIRLFLKRGYRKKMYTHDLLGKV